ncbi:Prolyl oligopeptidase family protein [Parasphingorhabdus marina DSM 22363]|uniref:Prolyl oligopeptidase family protein n=1 Tax=Parasphingorhabdus marina DSM 22363 TaxID=1123272 RepID=A0A1N6GC60_9SPHN|nr:alpha/beta fold hydrolase [Parasphingorhabdus marina]SIO05077.1 Prolyl oligopeptidase family protein [Parasphingorhabdus marina DSM 22363]
MRFALLLLTVIGFSASANAQTEAEPEWLFGQRQGVLDISLSPDGKQIVYVAPGPGRTSHVYHVNLADKQPKLISRSSGNPERITGCDFISGNRITCSVYGVRDIGGAIINYRENIALGTDGKDMQKLGQRQSFYATKRRQFDGFIVDSLPESDDVLMAWEFVPEVNASSKISRTADGMGVVRLNTKTGRWKGIEKARRTATDFLSDGSGNIRVIGFDVLTTRGSGSTVTRYSYRKAGEKKLHDLSTYDYLDRSGFRPLIVDSSTNSVFGLQLNKGKMALFSVSLDGSLDKKLVYAHPEVDVSGTKQFGRDQRVVGARYADEFNRVEYFDKSLASLSAQLSKALPGNPTLQFLQSSLNENILLLYAGSDIDPGRYYIFDRSQKRLEEIMLERPQLENISLARVKPVSYATPDGTTIPGYLTLPPGQNSSNLPAIVMPHGGPSSRDVWGFDWLAQYFASQGYAVLQPNFRGSDGFGQKWFEVNGFQQWPTAIGDISSGARWLVSEGIADPDKLAIVGWSYGGYAALQSGVTEPDLYKAIVAIAPVTDLRTELDNARKYTHFSNVLKYIGQGPHLVEGSPAQKAEKMKAPVIMFHGDMDLSVDVAHSRKMQNALKNANKESVLHEYKDLDHGLEDSNVRTRMLQEIDVFLGSHLK